MIELIAAVAKNGVIGGNNRMLWHIPEDFRFFRKTTTGHPVIMGRKTWTSIGRVLPGRLNIVVTRRGISVPEGVVMVRSLKEAIDCARQQVGATGRIFVIGGGEIYRQAMPFADRLWVTRVDGNFEGDARFPTIPRGRFRMTPLETLQPTQKRPWRVEFQRWDRRALSEEGRQ